jgi:hypothetical protein
MKVVCGGGEVAQPTKDNAIQAENAAVEIRMFDIMASLPLLTIPKTGFFVVPTGTFIYRSVFS